MRKLPLFSTGRHELSFALPRAFISYCSIEEIMELSTVQHVPVVLGNVMLSMGRPEWN